MTIKIYLESHHSDDLGLEFFLDDQTVVEIETVVHGKTATNHCIETGMSPSLDRGHHRLEIRFDQKHSQHWIHVREVEIDGVPSGWLLYKNSKFTYRHDGHCDQPGTELRASGTFLFEFEFPFWLYKVFLIEQMYKENEESVH